MKSSKQYLKEIAKWITDEMKKFGNPFTVQVLKDRVVCNYFNIMEKRNRVFVGYANGEGYFYDPATGDGIARTEVK